MCSTILNANTAKAKLLYNKQKELYKIVIAFNVFPKERDDGTIVYPFPPQNKCDFVSGNFTYQTLEADRDRIIAQAKRVLRTDNIEFV